MSDVLKALILDVQFQVDFIEYKKQENDRFMMMTVVNLTTMLYYFCRNPQGRTGLRGRGSLWRWGPNHNVLIVVSRWKRKYGHSESSEQDSDFIVIEGKRVLEMIVIKNSDTGEITLPGVSCNGQQRLKNVFIKLLQF